MADTSLPRPTTSASANAGRTGFGLKAFLYRSETARGYLLMSPTLVILTIGIIIPSIILFVMSLWQREGFGFDTTPTVLNYTRVWSEPIFGALLQRSFWISGLATVFTVLLCYPMAYYVAFHVHKNKMMWIILMTLPFWTSYLLRVFAWKVVLGYEGVINSGLVNLGFIQEPLEFLLYSQTAVVITLAHAWAAFAILPMYVSLEKIDKSLLEAATDLGDGPADSGQRRPLRHRAGDVCRGRWTQRLCDHYAGAVQLRRRHHSGSALQTQAGRDRAARHCQSICAARWTGNSGQPV